MALTDPVWLNENYLQDVLRKYENDESIEVSDLTVKAATAKGDNYASDMHRAAVKYRRIKDGREIHESRSLIVKAAPTDVREQMIEETGIFSVELLMMSTTLPKMSELLQKLGPSSLAARCLHVQYEKPIHVIVEDLAPRGFRMAERLAGLDLDHCLVAIRNLARFHAASVALKEKDPKAFVGYNKSMFHKDQPPTMKRFFIESAKAFADETANWSDLCPSIKEKLHKLVDVFYEKGCEATMYREDDFNVLNHGDVWVNNMLFRYDELQKPVEHIFVDFQLCHVGSPAEDILYFFGTSVADEIRIYHRELLLREYHASLINTMTKLGCKTEAPSFDDLLNTLEKRGFCEPSAAITVLPIVTLDKDKELDLTKVMEANGKFENPGYRGTSYRKIMNRLLPIFDSRGLLDV